MAATKLISGFTFIKNGLTLGYPIKESIQSIDPLCDEIIINVGYDDPDLLKDDGTFDYLKSHFSSDKYKFMKSYWDPKLTEKGLILSQQTNLALKNCRGKYCQYIQGDEAIHENDLKIIYENVKKMEERPEINGLVFNYIHFYGAPHIYRHTRICYRREVRLIRNNQGIQSYLDAQGFRHSNNTKVHCLKTDARIFHYGWARPEQLMVKKIAAMDKLYQDTNPNADDNFTYNRIWGLKKFDQTHPQVMNDWIQNNNTNLSLEKMKRKWSKKDFGLIISDFIEQMTGHRLGEYKNYLIIK